MSMGGKPMGRPKIYDLALREKLIDEANRMLETEGYHAVSLRVLTKNAGTSTNAVYTLFGSKEALMSEVIVRSMNERMEAALNRASGFCPVGQFMYMAGYYRVSASEAPKRFRGIFDAVKEVRHGQPAIGRIDPGMFRLGEHIFQPMLRAAEAIVEEDGLGHDPKLIAGSFWGAIHGLITLETDGLLDAQFSEPTDLYLETLDRLYAGWRNGASLPEECRQAFLQAQSDSIDLN